MMQGIKTQAEVMQPQETLKRAWASVTPLDRITFLWAFFGGLVIHLYRLTNFSMIPETPYFFYDQDNRADHGRWFLHHITDWTGWLDLQWLNGVIAIAYLAVACVVIVRLLKIKSPVTGAFAAILFMANPATVAMLHFTFLADGYAFAVLLGCLSVLSVQVLFERGLRATTVGVVIGAILLCLSLAIYQSNLSLTAFLCIAILIRAFLECDPKVWKRTAALLAMGAGGTLLYLGSVKLINVPMTDHAALNTMGEIDLAGSVEMLKWLYLDGSHPYMDLLTYPTALGWQLLGWLGLALFAGLILMLIVHTQLWKRPLDLVVVCVMMAAIPAAWWLINLLQPNAGVQNPLQANSSALTWPVLLAFGEYAAARLREAKRPAMPRAAQLAQWASWVCCALLAFHFAIFDNQFYTLTRLTYEKDQALYNRVLSRMEEQPEYQFGMPLLIEGAPEQAGKTTDFAEFSAKISTYMLLLQPRSNLYGDGQRMFMNSFLNADFRLTDEETKEQILASEEFAEMPLWPAEGSIRVIDGVMVMKCREAS